MLETIDRLLDRVTMYRLLLYYLIALVAAAAGLSLFGVLQFSAVSIIVSTLILVAACWVINKSFAFIFSAPTNVESVYITALILALIIAPAPSYTTESVGFLLAVSGLAMASKYILTIRQKHVFNPAAIAVVLTALGPRQSASWWVGTTALLPFVVIGGLLLVRKMRRERMVFSFFVGVLLATVAYSLMAKTGAFSTLDKTLTTSSMFFLGFVMLTEPLTTPPTSTKRTWYAVLVGLLFPPQVHLLSLYSTPELALIAGNVFSYLVSPGVKIFPRLLEKVRLTPDSVDFVFNPRRKFAYKPGQYMEWTLPHDHRDSRGNRRYFTLASSPTESELHLGVKFSKNGSSYKRALLQLSPESPIVADQIAGDFTLPNDPKQKLAFIAGGIGITPYRSMIKYLSDKSQPRDVTLFYSSRAADGFAYKDVFEEARRKVGIRTMYVLTGRAEVAKGQFTIKGRLSAEVLKQYLPDYRERLFYISGSEAMVVEMRHVLLDLGIPHSQIKLDHFSGYSARKQQSVAS